MAGMATQEAAEQRFDLTGYLRDCRELVIEQLLALVPDDARYRTILYQPMLDYPLRAAKALRPAICIATCRALGGGLAECLPSAAVLELYHNAFLIHDDVEDGSEKRRDQVTLHELHGIPIAVNVGDAMLALALEPLLDNARVIGLGKALRILRTVSRMARESAEGQAIELDWIRSGRWELGDDDYLEMVHKKTSWYTFITPMLMGGIIAGQSDHRLAALERFAALLGPAFQIQDDVLNLRADEGGYGKEFAGDLWEGKRTLILTHLLRSLPERERTRAVSVLGKPRPSVKRPAAEAKSESEVAWLFEQIVGRGSLDYAERAAHARARAAALALDEVETWMVPSVHTRFLRGLVEFVVQRNW